MSNLRDRRPFCGHRVLSHEREKIYIKTLCPPMDLGLFKIKPWFFKYIKVK